MNGDGEQGTIQIQQEPAYFPVDVVVFVSMLPSSIRFTCLPHSTMECLLKLPSLEMVFSTNRIDGPTQSKLENILSSVSEERENVFISETINNHQSSKNKSTNAPAANLNSNEGGLNVTCSMTDFSLKFYNRLAIRNPFESRFFYNDQSSNLVVI
jgi:hypothetical protein